MSSSASETHVPWAALAAAAGTGAYALPLTVPWHILLLAVSSIAGMVLCRTRARRWIWAALCAVVFTAVLSGYLPSPLAAAVVSASALTMFSAAAIAAAILIMNISVTATIQEFVAETISSAGLEAAGPTLIAIMILLLARFRFVVHAVGAGVLSVLGAWVAGYTKLSPETAMAIAALPACGLAALMVRDELSIGPFSPALPVAIVLVIGLSSWAWTMPRAWNETYFLTPEAPDSYEAKFFKNYLESLAFAGIEAKHAERLEDVSFGSLLLLPWLTSPYNIDAGDAFTKRIGELARERRWTVVVVGEHTDLGGVATRVEAMTGQPILRRDLTVPPGNTDNSGPLHTSDLRAWPHEAILNRGASVRVNSLADKVLMAGDGWWAEPDIGEWLWVGNYVPNSGDRAGRLALAVSSNTEGARWVVVGDNSLLINSQLFSDPRPVIRLLEMATLWPAFLRDTLVAAITLLICFPFATRTWHSRLPFMIVGSVAVLGFVLSFMPSATSIGWRDAYVGESGFNERNFNETLAGNPALIEDRRLIRMKDPVSGSVELPDGDSSIFMLVDSTATIGQVKLSQCRRMGSLLTVEGPYLMDAQACRVDGPAQVLIGTQEGAAAFVVPNTKGETIVLLDVAFLSQNAPDSNAKWLLKEFRQRLSRNRQE